MLEQEEMAVSSPRPLGTAHLPIMRGSQSPSNVLSAFGGGIPGLVLGRGLEGLSESRLTANQIAFSIDLRESPCLALSVGICRGRISLLRQVISPSDFYYYSCKRNSVLTFEQGGF
jgi:hypothetical protein